MAGYFDELHGLEQAIISALDKVPKDMRTHYEAWVQKHLRGVRREFARSFVEAKKAARSKRRP